MESRMFFLASSSITEKSSWVTLSYSVVVVSRSRLSSFSLRIHLPTVRLVVLLLGNWRSLGYLVYNMTVCLCRLGLWCFHVLIAVPHWVCSLVILHVWTLILILIYYQECIMNSFCECKIVSVTKKRRTRGWCCKVGTQRNVYTYSASAVVHGLLVSILSSKVDLSCSSSERVTSVEHGSVAAVIECCSLLVPRNIRHCIGILVTDILLK